MQITTSRDVHIGQRDCASFFDVLPAISGEKCCKADLNVSFD